MDAIPLQPEPDPIAKQLQETAQAQLAVGLTAQALDRRNKKLRPPERVPTLRERKKILAAKCRERRVRTAAGLVH